jgi:hypothetical protein
MILVLSWLLNVVVFAVPCKKLALRVSVRDDKIWNSYTLCVLSDRFSQADILRECECLQRG